MADEKSNIEAVHYKQRVFEGDHGRVSVVSTTFTAQILVFYCFLQLISVSSKCFVFSGRDAKHDMVQ